MDSDLFIALVGALVNMILSVTIPCLLKKSENKFLKDVQKVFQNNREVIITSSVIVAITIYLALKVSPDLELALSDMNDDLDMFHRPTSVMYSRELPPGLSNLVKLNR